MTARPSPERIILSQLHILRLMLSYWLKTEEARRKQMPLLSLILNTTDDIHIHMNMENRVAFVENKMPPFT